jgi:hypothetical protein
MINEKGNIEADLPGEITGIIFGINMLDKDKETIRNIIPGVRFYEVKKVPRKFQVEIINI